MAASGRGHEEDGDPYRIRQADTSPVCSGAVVSGYDWQGLSDGGNRS